MAVDAIVRGEGEISFLEVTQNFLHNMPFGNIEGVSLRNGGNVVHNRDRKFTREESGSEKILDYYRKEIIPNEENLQESISDIYKSITYLIH